MLSDANFYLGEKVYNEILKQANELPQFSWFNIGLIFLVSIKLIPFWYQINIFFIPRIARIDEYLLIYVLTVNI